MKSYMEFSLPEETSEHYYALNGNKLRDAVVSFINQLDEWRNEGAHEFNCSQEALDATSQLIQDKLSFDNIDLYHNM